MTKRVDITIRFRRKDGKRMDRAEAQAAINYLVERERIPVGYELMAVDWMKGGKLYTYDNLRGVFPVLRSGKATLLRVDQPDESL